MAPSNGTTNNAHPSPHPPLNERILSSMTRRSVAAHPWHDLEIGMQYTSLSFIVPFMWMRFYS